MSLAIGTELGPYKIVAPLGAGGMGEVYRATDTNLKRQVAIKVLPDTVASDLDRLARFQREAEVLAALNHPNIAHIHGLEKSDGTIALVMELVEGPTLADRIARGAMPLDEALPIAKQIAEALDAAHEKGIIHRDLKPANVKLTPDGVVKVLDFGLAKAMDPTTTSGGLANSPTLTVRATQLGMILGTAAYMSPEQARGKAVDRRADIWAFGCVLYELLTGRRAFEGDAITDVLARLIERDPLWTALPPETTPEIRRLLARCLTKDPKARLRDIGEARITIEESLAGKPLAPATEVRPPAAARGAWLRLLPWGLAAAFALAAVVLFLRQPAAPTSNRAVRTELELPADVEFFSGPSISADGMKVVFIGVRQGIRQIYMRVLDAQDTRPIAGTEAVTSVAISPSGQALAFVTTDLWLKRLTFSSGIVEPIAVGADIISRPAWAGDQSIVFSRGGKIVLRPAADSERELATPDAAAGDVSLLWPIVTDDGARVLFTARRKTPQGTRHRVEAVSLRGGDRHVVLEDVEQIVFAAADQLVFQRGDALFRIGFDQVHAKAVGAPTRLGEPITAGSTGLVATTVARAGTYVAAPPSVFNGHLVWVSASGVEHPVTAPARAFQNPRVSPNGGSIAFSELGTIWTLDPERGTFTRLTPGSEPNIGFPVWSSDGTRVYFRSQEGIRVQRADAEGAPALLPNTGGSDYPSSFTPDGKTLVFLRITPESGGDIYTTPAEGGELKPIVATTAYEGGPQVSPDGKWLLYVSNESGSRMEIFLRPFGGPDRKWSVSSDGGLHPLWSRDGRRIFYRSGQSLLAVDVTTTPEVRLGTPKVLFAHRYEFGPNLTIPNFSLSADGREFLMVQEEPGGRHLSLVLNWLQNLSR